MAALASSDPQTIEQVQSSVKDVKVDMDGDLVKAYVIFDFHGKDLSLELDGHLSAQNGYVKFDPVAGKAGFASPTAIHARFSRRENDVISREP